MRAALVLIALAASAAANPRARSPVMERPAPIAREVRAPTPVATPPRMREPGRRPELAHRIARPLQRAKPERHEVTMPSVWSALRDVVSRKLPHGGDDRAFSYTLMPMVITGAADSAPGLGLSGSF